MELETYNSAMQLPEHEMLEIAGIPQINFGQLIKSVRTELKLTQREMAELLGVALRTYESWESGRYLPSGQHLMDILLLRAKSRNINLKALFL